MTKGRQLAVMTVALAVSRMAFADCSYPKAPQQIPDGKSASETEMLQAMTVFKQYNGDVNAYTVCLEKETADKVREAGDVTLSVLQIKSLQAKKHNAAVDELKEKAKQFNEQVRLFKSRGK